MPNKPSVPAVLYAAKSTEDKHDSIPDQLARGRAFAEREDWEIAGEFSDENFSAYSRNRGPDLEKAKILALHLAERRGKCFLVALHSDRVARGAGDAPNAADHLVEVVASLRRHRVLLRTVEDDFFADDRIGLLMAAVMGQRNTEDSRRKSESVAAGFRRRAELRGQHSGPAPYGYVYAKDGSGLVVEPTEADVVRRIFREYVAGVSLTQIAKRLQSDRVKTKRGATYWRQAQVSGFVRNPIYIGKVKYKDDLFDGAHEPILDRDLWDKAQQLIAALPPRPGRRLSTAKRHLFTGGFLRCADCGCPMVPNRRTKVNYEFYECTGRLHGCKTGAVRRQDVDEGVFAYFEQVALDVEATREELHAAMDHRIRELDGLLDAAEREAAETNRRIARIRTDYMDGDLSAAQWQSFQQELERESEAADSQAAQLRDRLETARSGAAFGDAEAEVAEHLSALRAAIRGDLQAAQDLDGVRAVLRRIFDCFLFHPTVPDDAHIELVGSQFWIEPVVSERAVDGYDETMRPLLAPQPLADAVENYKQGSGWLNRHWRSASEALGAGSTP